MVSVLYLVNTVGGFKGAREILVGVGELGRESSVPKRKIETKTKEVNSIFTSVCHVHFETQSEESESYYVYIKEVRQPR